MKEKGNQAGLKKNQATAPQAAANPASRMHPGLAAAIARGKILRKKMSLAEGGSMSAEKTAKLLGISVSKLIYRWRCHRLIAWQLRKSIRFPVWQFRDGKLLPGIEEVLQIFQSDDQWRVMLYFLGNRRSLAKERPLDLLRRGESAKVIKHATDYAMADEW